LWHAGSLRAPRLGYQRRSILTLPAARHYRRCMSTLPPRISPIDQNKAVAEGVLQSGYYGADVVAQRQRSSRRELAYIALEFFERRDLFLVSRESGMAFP
jgi:hypothetical protein